MRHYRFITDKIVSNLAILDASESNHLKNVIRIKLNEQIILFDLESNSYYLAVYSEDRANLCACRVISQLPKNENKEVNLIIAFIKNDLIEFIIEKSVELGINSITIFTAERSQDFLKQEQLEKKLSRYKKIAIAAIKQCGSAKLPEVKYLKDYTIAIKEKSEAQNKLIFLAPDYENKDNKYPTKRIFENLQSTSKEAITNIIIGPEGGLTNKEIELALSLGYKPTTLGANTLRAETAVISALACTMDRLYG